MAKKVERAGERVQKMMRIFPEDVEIIEAACRRAGLDFQDFSMSAMMKVATHGEDDAATIRKLEDEINVYKTTLRIVLQAETSPGTAVCCTCHVQYDCPTCAKRAKK